MRMLSTRVVLTRLIIMAILGAFVYPFLPAKNKWEIQAAFGDREADSLLNEFYQPPIDGALQFAIEVPFAITTDTRTLITRRDVRFVELGDKLWGKGKVWVVHIRSYALDALKDQLRDHPSERVWVELERGWRAPLDLPAVRSPLYIDPAAFSKDPYFARSVLEDWYAVPF